MFIVLINNWHENPNLENSVSVRDKRTKVLKFPVGRMQFDLHLVRISREQIVGEAFNWFIVRNRDANHTTV